MTQASILLVEDNPLNAELAATLLREAGFAIIEATTGHQALSALDGQTVDLVLLDLHLPDLSGYEVAERIRRHPRHGNMKLIALTAMALSSEADKAIEAGCDGVLFKPIDILTFADSVREFLDHHRVPAEQESGHDASLAPRPQAADSSRILHDMRSSVAAFKSGVALLSEQLSQSDTSADAAQIRLDPEQILAQLQNAAEQLQQRIKDMEAHLR